MGLIKGFVQDIKIFLNKILGLSLVEVKNKLTNKVYGSRQRL
jgi:hypothetical protein